MDIAKKHWPDPIEGISHTAFAVYMLLHNAVPGEESSLEGLVRHFNDHWRRTTLKEKRDFLRGALATDNDQALFWKISQNVRHVKEERAKCEMRATRR